MKVDELVEEIAALEHRLAEAQQAGNRAALHHLVAADYTGITADGRRVNRESFIDTFVTPELLMETVQLENLTVRSFEHVAIASGISHARGFARKQPFRHRYNFTHVWVRRVMHWELVGGHISVAS